MAIKIQNEFDLKQQVYVLTDPDQNLHIITAILILPDNALMYRAACGGEDADYYAFELAISPRVF